MITDDSVSADAAVVASDAGFVAGFAAGVEVGDCCAGEEEPGDRTTGLLLLCRVLTGESVLEVARGGMRAAGEAASKPLNMF